MNEKCLSVCPVVCNTRTVLRELALQKSDEAHMNDFGVADSAEQIVLENGGSEIDTFSMDIVARMLRAEHANEIARLEELSERGEAFLEELAVCEGPLTMRASRGHTQVTTTVCMSNALPKTLAPGELYEPVTIVRTQKN